MSTSQNCSDQAQPSLVVLRFDDDAHSVVILRYVELELDVNHNEKSMTFSVEVKLLPLK